MFTIEWYLAISYRTKYILWLVLSKHHLKPCDSSFVIKQKITMDMYIYDTITETFVAFSFETWHETCHAEIEQILRSLLGETKLKYTIFVCTLNKFGSLGKHNARQNDRFKPVRIPLSAVKWLEMINRLLQARVVLCTPRVPICLQKVPQRVMSQMKEN